MATNSISPVDAAAAHQLIAWSWLQYDISGRPGVAELYEDSAILQVDDTEVAGRVAITERLSASVQFAARHVPSPASWDPQTGIARYTVTAYVGLGEKPWDPTPALVLDVVDVIVDVGEGIRLRHRSLRRVFERKFL